MECLCRTILFGLLLCSLCGCAPSDATNKTDRALYTSISGKLATLDPIYASDVVSRDMVAEVYDSLLQYDYAAKPYKLIPSMLKAMPTVNADATEFSFELRDDLYFIDDECFENGKGRKITSGDVLYSLLRMADTHNHSPVYWTIRGKIAGFNEFHHLTQTSIKGDYSPYDGDVNGFTILSDTKFTISLLSSDPRFLYMLATPWTSIVCREAVEMYGDDFREHPVGSGPFRLKKWRRNHSLEFVRNETYRREVFPEASNPADRSKQLPLLDSVTCYLIDQQLSAWLMFLKGEMDLNSLNKENFEAVVDKKQNLVPALAERKINLMQLPEFQINYIGFGFADPIVGKNVNLRKAISLAYNTQKRIEHFNHQLRPAHGPIPPGVAGYDSKYKNEFSEYDIAKAKEFLTAAGYPDGIDSATNKPLELTFDLGSTSPANRQLAEMFVKDMAEIGIAINASLNNSARFKQKLRKGDVQIFKYSWIGDYPDAENFLQLFYSPNAGGSNRASYSNAEYDHLFKEVIPMSDSPERTILYKNMANFLTKQCPWIFESFPVSYRLTHSWLQNYIPHDFAFARWKYLSLDLEERTRRKKNMKPLPLDALR